MLGLVGFIGLGAELPAAEAQVARCDNPGNKVFHSNPPFAAPEETRAVGILIGNGQGGAVPIPDRRSRCLPLGLRLNNPGAQQSRSAPGQTARDGKGHAVFDTVESGVAEVLAWLERRRREGNDTALLMMSRYAPPDDCIGSVDKVRNPRTGRMECPRGFPLNPTREYAEAVATTVGKGINERLGLGQTRCGDEREAAKRLVERIVTMESGSGFCRGICTVDQSVFARAINRVWGEIPAGCSAR